MSKPRTSTRDEASTLVAFAEWLGAEVDAVATPTVTTLGGPSGAGLSSDTLLIDLDWSTSQTDGAAAEHHRECVLRLPPPGDAFPIFETYDLARQVEAMRTVRDGCVAPVPEVLWFEPDPSAIGTSFFVMDRIDGIVPPDVMPYTWGSWVTDLPTDQLSTMTDDAIDVLVAIHSVAPTPVLIDAARNDGSGATSLERHVSRIRRYFEWAAAGRRFPTIERGFELLTNTIPAIDRDDVLLWGDSRIGNILWREARAVAILDWEMTTVGPRELDVAWMTYFAMSFQRSAENRELPGAPKLLTRDAIVERYERATATTLVELDWFLALTSLFQSLIAIRTTDRSVAFGEDAPAPDPEAPLHPIPMLTLLLDALEHD